ncbi:hypothetical protein M2444_002214 [Paenibacillus sp. PastF-3]|nr:hypothetical protein [Paenibacillus sp. PastF-3]
MHWKKYFILLLPTILIGLFLFYILPAIQRPYVLIVPMVFWLIYYSWTYFKRKQKNKR